MFPTPNPRNGLNLSPVQQVTIPQTSCSPLGSQVGLRRQTVMSCYCHLEIGCSTHPRENVFEGYGLIFYTPIFPLYLLIIKLLFCPLIATKTSNEPIAKSTQGGE